MGSPGHWLRAESGPCGSRSGSEAPYSKVLGWPDRSPAEGEDAEATEVCFAWEEQRECEGRGPGGISLQRF